MSQLLKTESMQKSFQISVSSAYLQKKTFNVSKMEIYLRDTVQNNCLDLVHVFMLKLILS